MAVPTSRGSGSAAGNAAAIAPGLPAGTVAGDLLIMFVETANQTSTASGWASAPSSPQGIGTAGDAAASRLTVLYKIAVGGDATTTNDSGDHQIGFVMGIAVDTFDAANPFNTSAGGTQAATTAVSVPGSTTTVNDCLIFACATGALPDVTGTDEFSGWANADLTSVVDLRDTTNTSGNGGAIALISGEKLTAGAYGASTATAVTSAARGCISLAIAPPSAATVDPYPYIGGGYYPTEG